MRGRKPPVFWKERGMRCKKRVLKGDSDARVRRKTLWEEGRERYRSRKKEPVIAWSSRRGRLDKGGGSSCNEKITRRRDGEISFGEEETSKESEGRNSMC